MTGTLICGLVRYRIFPKSGTKFFCNMDTKKYVNEISANGSVCESLSVLNAYKSELLNECKDSEFLAAKVALEKARAAFKAAANKVVLGDANYLNLQTECVRTAVSEFSRTHKLPGLFKWFNDNGKDEQTVIIDTPQKLGSKLKALHDTFASGAKVSRSKKLSVDDLRAKLLAKQKELAELNAQLEKAGVK